MAADQDQAEEDGHQEDPLPGGKDDEEAQRLLAAEFEFEDNNDTATPGRGRLSRWLAGPAVPQIQAIKPLFPSYQRLPIQFLDHNLPRKEHRVVALIVLLLFWLPSFVPLVWTGGHALTDGDGRDVVNLDCVDTLWGRKNRCGLDGIDCEPFSNTSFAARCPAHCAGVQLWNPHAVGPLDVNYRPLVVGDAVYRGDSFICGAAIHAGVIGDGGGCARVALVGLHAGFPGTARHGLESVAFDSYFPLSFTVATDASFTCTEESRISLLLISLLFTATISVYTTSPLCLFFTAFTLIFIHVSFVSDPPAASFFNTSVLPDHTSSFAARFLPAVFCAVVLYWTCVRRTLQGLDAQYEKTLYWLGGFWLGALSNYTFDWIPIQRLTAHDLEQQPGAKLALAVVLLVLVLIVLQQVYYFRREGRLLRYLALYGVLLTSILVLLLIPGVDLRIHHYIVTLLLLPGTSMQTRPSLLYQGLLLGLFVNGVARWGFDSVLQTPGVLRADGAFNSLLPVIKDPVVALVTGLGAPNISFAWAAPPSPANMDGLSVLVNDVERHRFFFDEVAISDHVYTWARPRDFSLHEYFRFAYIRRGITLDYTKAGTWFANGTWSFGNS